MTSRFTCITEQQLENDGTFLAKRKYDDFAVSDWKSDAAKSVTKTCVWPLPCSPPKSSHLFSNLATLVNAVHMFAGSQCRFLASEGDGSPFHQSIGTIAVCGGTTKIAGHLEES